MKTVSTPRLGINRAAFRATWSCSLPTHLPHKRSFHYLRALCNPQGENRLSGTTGNWTCYTAAVLTLSFQGRPSVLFASCLRISPDLSAFYRAKSLIFFVFNSSRLTLDQHIGVRIP